MSRLRDLQQEPVAAQVLPSNLLADGATDLLGNPLPHLRPLPPTTVGRGLLQRGEQFRLLLLVEHQRTPIVRTPLTKSAEPLGMEAFHLVANPATRAADGIADGDKAPAFRHQADGFDGAADVDVVDAACSRLEFINAQVRLELDAGHNARVIQRRHTVNQGEPG